MPTHQPNLTLTNRNFKKLLTESVYDNEVETLECDGTYPVGSSGGNSGDKSAAKVDKDHRQCNTPASSDSPKTLNLSRRNMRGSLTSNSLTEITLHALLKPFDINCNGSILKRDLVASLRSNGLGKRHPGMLRFYKEVEEYDGESGEIPIDVLVALITAHSQDLVLSALQGRMVIPDFGYFTKEISKIAENVLKNTTHGEVSKSLPELARVAENNFAVSITTVTGQMFSFGDVAERFCLQSVSKVLTYCEALKSHGAAVVHDHVGREPSGTSFNAMSLKRHPRRPYSKSVAAQSRGADAKVEEHNEATDDEEEEDDGAGHASTEVSIPHNPYINAGAILCSTLMSPGEEQHARIGNYLKAWGRCCGSAVGFDPCVQVADMADADRNNALCYMMREGHAFLDEDVNVRDAIEIYCATRAVTCTANQLAAASATLANGGTNPLTHEHVYDDDICKNAMSLMLSCGMYDFSGEWAFTVGLPAKSAVSGAIMIIVPNIMGIAVWAPPLDKNGNSVRGVEFARQLVSKFALHHLDFQGITGDKIDPTQSKLFYDTQARFSFMTAASAGDVSTLSMLVESRACDVNVADYDHRTAMHLASADGHSEAVQFLLDHGADPNPMDRWGNTPLGDARAAGNTDVAAMLEAVLQTHADPTRTTALPEHPHACRVQQTAPSSTSGTGADA
eukprot:m.516984 g.516984  ORF g.516984 m.516984 type:complete len:678 (-) comp21934_c0_seq4:2104-4137(-)